MAVLIFNLPNRARKTLPQEFGQSYRNDTNMRKIDVFEQWTCLATLATCELPTFEPVYASKVKLLSLGYLPIALVTTPLLLCIWPLPLFIQK